MQPADGQAALDLPSAGELFPHRRSDFAEYCLGKIRALLMTPAQNNAAAVHWNFGMNASDRRYLCRLAGVGLDLAAHDWEAIDAPTRARILAAFERLAMWLRSHAAFSVGARGDEFIERFSTRKG